MHSVAEGVETVEELNVAARVGCRRVQGSYFSRPVPAVRVRQLLNASHGRRSPDEQVVALPLPTRSIA